MLKTHFKGESETRKMSNLKDFGGHAMNWNIGVLAENTPRKAWRMTHSSLLLATRALPLCFPTASMTVFQGQESLRGFQVRSVKL